MRYNSNNQIEQYQSSRRSISQTEEQRERDRESQSDKIPKIQKPQRAVGEQQSSENKGP